MRRFFLLGVVLAGVSSGCASTVGPFKRTTGGEAPNNPNRPDSPLYSLTEQERRGRAAWSLPDESYIGGPRSGAAHSIMGNGVTNGLNTGR